jgi:hypothetical protein
VNFFATSNFLSNVLVLPVSARRFSVETTEAPKMPNALRTAFFKLVGHETPAQPAGPGGAMLRHWLRRRDVSVFDPYADPPKTLALTDIQDESVPEEQQRIEELFATSLSCGYGTAKTIEDAVQVGGYRPRFPVTPKGWITHLRKAAKARGVIVSERRQINALIGRPSYYFWGADYAAVTAAVTAFVKLAKNAAGVKK